MWTPCKPNPRGWAGEGSIRYPAEEPIERPGRRGRRRGARAATTDRGDGSWPGPLSPLRHRQRGLPHLARRPASSRWAMLTRWMSAGPPECTAMIPLRCSNSGRSPSDRFPPTSAHPRPRPLPREGAAYTFYATPTTPRQRLDLAPRERRRIEAAGLSLDVVAYAAPQEPSRSPRTPNIYIGWFSHKMRLTLARLSPAAAYGAPTDARPRRRRRRAEPSRRRTAGPRSGARPAGLRR